MPASLMGRCAGGADMARRSEKTPGAYPRIESLGVTGDRRTAALVAPDGTIPWLCLPDYDGTPVFGSLLDARRGGGWRFGPAEPASGEQAYAGGTPILTTRWRSAGSELELTDLMPWSELERTGDRGGHRVVLRRLRCTQGTAQVAFRLRPRDGFEGPLPPTDGGWRLGEARLSLWASFPLTVNGKGAEADLGLAAGEEAWAAFGLGVDPGGWSVEAARQALADTARYWRDWLDGLVWAGPRRERVLRSAVTIHLLGYAPAGAVVAAPTTSLPEVVGGEKNYDYRFAWIRDASLSLAILAVLGDLESAQRYMDWLAGLGTSNEMPLQVLYRIGGSTDVAHVERHDLEGYEGSRPVRFGNHAFAQLQIDSLGYLADCAQIYLEQGGAWRPAYDDLMHRLAYFTVAHWRRPDSGIWELPEGRHYVSSKVMAWVVLDRACRIAERTGLQGDVPAWQAVMDEIRAEVLDRGWSERVWAFRQHYDTDALDASVLLIPIMGFLPADHPRVLATVERIAERLSVDGLVWRFATRERRGAGDHPGEEGAFLPCTFWHAAVLARLGRPEAAEAVLERVEALAGPLGLLAEETDPRAGRFLGNTPLLFSHAEYLRAVMEIGKARLPTRLTMMAGHLAKRVRTILGA